MTGLPTDALARLDAAIVATLRLSGVADPRRYSGKLLMPVRHVLWQHGDSGGIAPGSFVRHLLAAMAQADDHNLGLLTRVYPVYGTLMGMCRTGRGALLMAAADQEDGPRAPMAVRWDQKPQPRPYRVSLTLLHNEPGEYMPLARHLSDIYPESSPWPMEDSVYWTPAPEVLAAATALSIGIADPHGRV